MALPALQVTIPFDGRGSAVWYLDDWHRVGFTRWTGHGHGAGGSETITGLARRSPARRGLQLISVVGGNAYVYRTPVTGGLATTPAIRALTLITDINPQCDLTQSGTGLFAKLSNIGGSNDLLQLRVVSSVWQIALLRRDGSTATLALNSDGQMAVNTWYTLRLTYDTTWVNGPAAWCWINGVLAGFLEDKTAGSIILPDTGYLICQNISGAITPAANYANSGFDNGLHDVSYYARHYQSTRGRANITDAMTAATADVTLDNRDGRFGLQNRRSVLYPGLIPTGQAGAGRPASPIASRTITVGSWFQGAYTPRFTGVITEPSQETRMDGPASVTLACVDLIDQIRSLQPITVPLQQGQRTDQLFRLAAGQISNLLPNLSYTALTTSARPALSAWAATSQQPLDVLTDLAAEDMGATFYFDRSGVLTFEPSSYRQGRALLATLTQVERMQLAERASDLYDTAIVTYAQNTIQGGTVYTSSSWLQFTYAGARFTTVSIAGNYSQSPIGTPTTPLPGQDIFLNDTSGGGGTDHSVALAVTGFTPYVTATSWALTAQIDWLGQGMPALPGLTIVYASAMWLAQNYPGQRYGQATISGAYSSLPPAAPIQPVPGVDIFLNTKADGSGADISAALSIIGFTQVTAPPNNGFTLTAQVDFGNPLIPLNAPTTVYSSGAWYVIINSPAGLTQGWIITVPYTTVPNITPLTPVIGTDVNLNSAFDGSGTNLNSRLTIASFTPFATPNSFSISFSINFAGYGGTVAYINIASLRAQLPQTVYLKLAQVRAVVSGGVMYVELAQIRGTALITSGGSVAIARSASALRVNQTIQRAAPWVSNAAVAQQYANNLAAVFGANHPRTIIDLVGKDTATTQAILAGDISQRIALNDHGAAWLSGFNGQFFIEQITETFTPADMPRATWTLFDLSMGMLQPAPTAAFGLSAALGLMQAHYPLLLAQTGIAPAPRPVRQLSAGLGLMQCAFPIK